MNYTEEELKERERKEAKRELIKLDAIEKLAEDNELACMIEIGGLGFGLCDNSKILPLVKFQKEEIQKFLNGEKNMWE